MSANIEISKATGAASFVWGRQPGWHKLGKQAQPGDTITDLQARAGHFPVNEGKVYRADGTAIDGYKYLCKSDGTELCIMPSTYEVHQAHKLWDLYVSPFMATGRTSLDAAGSLDDGRKIWVCARLEGLAADITGKGDTVLPFISFCSSYDGSLKTEVLFHDSRIVCANTLAIARGSKATKAVSAKHTKHSVLKLEQIAESINLESQDFSANVKVYQAMTRTPFSANQLAAYIRAVFTPAKVEDEDGAKRLLKQIEPMVRWSSMDLDAAHDRIVAMADLPAGPATPVVDSILDDILARAEDQVMEIVETPNRVGGVSQLARGTMWDAYNATTEYLTHERGHGPASRLESLWFGPAAVQASRAFDVARAMATGAPMPRC